MPTYEKLKAKIQSSNVDIMRLQFGCEVLIDGTTSYRTKIIDAWDFPPNRKYKLLGHDHEIFTREMLEQPLGNKILGRPITLADVLLAIEKKGLTNWFVTAQGYFGEITDAHDYKATSAYWDLTKDLERQSEKCKDFLIKLLL